MGNGFENLRQHVARKCLREKMAQYMKSSVVHCSLLLMAGSISKPMRVSDVALVLLVVSLGSLVAWVRVTPLAIEWTLPPFLAGSVALAAVALGLWLHELLKMRRTGRDWETRLNAGHICLLQCPTTPIHRHLNGRSYELAVFLSTILGLTARRSDSGRSLLHDLGESMRLKSSSFAATGVIGDVPRVLGRPFPILTTLKRVAYVPEKAKAKYVAG